MLLSRVCEVCNVSKNSSEYSLDKCNLICVDCLTRRKKWILKKLRDGHNVYYDHRYIQTTISMYFDKY